MFNQKESCSCNGAFDLFNIFIYAGEKPGGRGWLKSLCSCQPRPLCSSASSEHSITLEHELPVTTDVNCDNTEQARPSEHKVQLYTEEQAFEILDQNLVSLTESIFEDLVSIPSVEELDAKLRIAVIESDIPDVNKVELGDWISAFKPNISLMIAHLPTLTDEIETK